MSRQSVDDMAYSSRVMERICNELIDWPRAGEGGDKQDVMNIMEQKQEELHKLPIRSKSSTSDDVHSNKKVNKRAGA